MTPDETDDFSADILAANNLDSSSNVLNRWVFNESTVNGVLQTTSRFTGLSTGHPYWWVASGGNEAQPTWIKFEIKTYIRIGSSNRKRRSASIDDLLGNAFAVDNEVISSLQNTLILPGQASLLETTETEEELAIISPEGEEAGSCSLEGCECNSGYEKQEDGSCAPPPPALPDRVRNGKFLFVLYQIIIKRISIFRINF